ncbi:FAD:protein FMN transferase [Actomonas aquatica]|uniref:FAD:protein FMN transferase n=1 Tax=Actomonas aquatica TaxID=2866162 RepID=A0ABZ1C9S2_9BACT|nr:FAD:protein FMN transferase [Opitutus sp. WL0086]WRQ88437.1 FAD:protein FMN transferase [Opitutus sp. WL0086]
MSNPPPLVQLLELEGLQRFEHEAMATQFVLHLAPPPGGSVRQVAAEAFALLDRLEDQLSFYREGSDVTRINRASPGEVVRINEITHHCLLTALEVSAASAGAFDPFAGGAALIAKGQPLPPHLRDVPSPEPDDQRPALALDPAQPLITKLEGSRWLDLGAVGKGAALNAMAALLQDWDIPTAVLVAGGSSIKVFGPPPQSDQTTWTLRLAALPGQPEVELPAPFALGASGGGFQAGHIIAPSGFTSRTQSLVLAPDAALADALSTAAYLLSDDALQRLFAEAEDCAVLATRERAAPLRTGVFATWRRAAPQLSLVIPCWREQERLPPFLEALAAAIDTAALPVEVLVVDDGSPADDAAATREAVRRISERFPQIQPMIDIDRHRGKGGAVYWGWRHAAPSVQWLGFVDADGAIPPEEVVRGIQQTLAQPDDASPRLIAATRYHRDSTRRVQRGFWRQRTGGWFANWARTQLQLGAADSQCGFKVVPAAWWRDREPWQVDGYDFDLELLLAARDDQLTVRNLPITWREIPGSHVGVGDGLNLVKVVKRLRRERPPRG